MPYMRFQLLPNFVVHKKKYGKRSAQEEEEEAWEEEEREAGLRETAEYFHSLDSDGDLGLDGAEFRSFLLERRPGTNPMLHQSWFGSLDADRDGLIRAWEFDADLDEDALIRFKRK